jgi:predicted secreted Zn-dependent protease
LRRRGTVPKREGTGVRAILRLLAACCAAASTPASAEWQVVEKENNYSISGKTGPQLYESIGARGPRIRGEVRTIAHTSFTLTWTRKYEVQADACMLSSAVPKLTITYTLPKPSMKLSGVVATNWQTFIAGMRNHEHQHGEMIMRLVKDIEAATVGMTVADDANCTKIKTELKSRLKKLFAEYQQRNRDFDKTEMTEGGNIQQLILGLVNGG